MLDTEMRLSTTLAVTLLIGWSATARAEPPDVCAAVTDRALANLGATPHAAAGWSARARRAALLPSVKARISYIDYGGQYVPTSDSATPLDVSYKNGRQFRVDLELGWELGRVAWNRDELAINRERARIAERRKNTRLDVVEVCFAKAHLERALLTARGDERNDLVLDLARVDARLAALADGDL